MPLLFSAADRQHYCDLSGVSVDVTAAIGGQRFREKMLFTHRGLSGPAILEWNPPAPKDPNRPATESPGRMRGKVVWKHQPLSGDHGGEAELTFARSLPAGRSGGVRKARRSRAQVDGKVGIGAVSDGRPTIVR